MTEKQKQIIAKMVSDCFLQVLYNHDLISLIEFYELKNFELCQRGKQKLYL